MKRVSLFRFVLILLLSFQVAVPPGLLAQGAEGPKPFTQEELDQLLAPLALHPDSLLAQILMASTYPLEVVQADRWAKQNKNLKGDALAAALEKQNWDPSVKSLVNFPPVLEMMSEKLDWTQKLGDAFIAQEKEVMQTVQKLRQKAEAQGNLKTTKEQKVTVEQETKVIVIEPADPQVVYVPTYNPTVVYGTWWYPAPPPYYYYPPGYAAGAALFTFGVGLAVGAAWGYAWGGCGWGRGEVNVDIDRNTNINNSIDRDKYKNEMKNKGQVNAQGQGKFQHDPSHRKGVSYRDQATSQKYNRGASTEATKARDSYRGKGEQGKQDLARGGGDQVSDRSGGERGSERGDRDSAFGGSDRGSEVRQQSDRGSSSRESMSSGGKGPGSGGSRGGGGGGGRGGGGRR